MHEDHRDIPPPADPPSDPTDRIDASPAKRPAGADEQPAASSDAGSATEALLQALGRLSEAASRGDDATHVTQAFGEKDAVDPPAGTAAREHVSLDDGETGSHATPIPEAARARPPAPPPAGNGDEVTDSTRQAPLEHAPSATERPHEGGGSIESLLAEIDQIEQALEPLAQEMTDEELIAEVQAMFGLIDEPAAADDHDQQDRRFPDRDEWAEPLASDGVEAEATERTEAAAPDLNELEAAQAPAHAPEFEPEIEDLSADGPAELLPDVEPLDMNESAPQAEPGRNDEWNVDDVAAVQPDHETSIDERAATEDEAPLEPEAAGESAEPAAVDSGAEPASPEPHAPAESAVIDPGVTAPPGVAHDGERAAADDEASQIDAPEPRAAEEMTVVDELTAEPTDSAAPEAEVALAPETPEEVADQAGVAAVDPDAHAEPIPDEAAHHAEQSSAERAIAASDDLPAQPEGAAAEESADSEAQETSAPTTASGSEDGQEETADAEEPAPADAGLEEDDSFIEASFETVDEVLDDIFCEQATIVQQDPFGPAALGAHPQPAVPVTSAPAAEEESASAPAAANAPPAAAPDSPTAAAQPAADPAKQAETAPADAPPPAAVTAAATEPAPPLDAGPAGALKEAGGSPGSHERRPLVVFLRLLNLPLRVVPPALRPAVDLLALTALVWVPIVWLLVLLKT